MTKIDTRSKFNMAAGHIENYIFGHKSAIIAHI